MQMLHLVWLLSFKHKLPFMFMKLNNAFKVQIFNKYEQQPIFIVQTTGTELFAL